MLVAHTSHAQGSMFDSAHSIGYSASFGYASRQAAAHKGACDMDSLKLAISHATPGTGQVKQAITDATFVPRAPAFTSLIQTCAKCRQVQKAIEVFDTMANNEAIDVRPNTVHYRYATGTLRPQRAHLQLHDLHCNLPQWTTARTCVPELKIDCSTIVR